nr:hypothetical protein [Micromonospora sp. DSM 115978]
MVAKTDGGDGRTRVAGDAPGERHVPGTGIDAAGLLVDWSSLPGSQTAWTMVYVGGSTMIAAFMLWTVALVLSSPLSGRPRKSADWARNKA